MSLAKIPVIFLVTAGFTMITGHTASRRRAPKKDVIRASIFESQLWLTLMFKTYIVQILVGALEVAMILARSYPSSPTSQLILSSITFGSSEPDRLPNPHLSATTALGSIIFLLGMALRVRTYADLGLMFSGDVAIRKDHRLITSGAYSVARHPAYTGYTLAVIGWIFWSFGKGSWIHESGLWNSTQYGKIISIGYAFFLIYGVALCVGRIPGEDALMKKTFGKEWEEWARRVPYVLIPGIY